MLSVYQALLLLVQHLLFENIVNAKRIKHDSYNLVFSDPSEAAHVMNNVTEREKVVILQDILAPPGHVLQFPVNLAFIDCSISFQIWRQIAQQSNIWTLVFATPVYKIPSSGSLKVRMGIGWHYQYLIRRCSNPGLTTWISQIGYLLLLSCDMTKRLLKRFKPSLQPNLKQEGVTTGKTDGQTHRQTDAGQNDPYVPLCFAGDTKNQYLEWYGIHLIDIKVTTPLQ